MSKKIFLINLERQKSRLDFMTEQLAKLEITFQHLLAVNGRDPVAIQNSAAAFYATLTPGEIGCFESHREIWAKVVDQNLDGAFALEDDVIVSSDLSLIDFSFLDEKGIDIVKIDQNTNTSSNYGVERIACGTERDIVRLLGTEYCTGCYYVSNRGARKLLQLSKNYFLPVDRFLFDNETKTFWQLNIWKLDPPAAVQRRMYEGDDEDNDSISSNRVSKVEIPRKVEVLGNFLLRVRRLVNWDFKQARIKRKERKFKEFKKTEKIESRYIEFYSPSVDHIESQS